MKCNEIEARLDAFLDRELPHEAAGKITAHLEACRSCRQKAALMADMSRALDALPVIPAPKGFARNVCRALRPEPQDLAQWWHNLTLAWRSAVCGAALAGLVCGAVLGTSTSAVQDPVTPLYQALYDTGELFL